MKHNKHLIPGKVVDLVTQQYKENEKKPTKYFYIFARLNNSKFNVYCIKIKATLKQKGQKTS